MSRSNELPGDIRRFILTSIPSVPFLEAALLLRAQENAAWDAQLLARRLYVPERQAEELLRALREAGIAGPTGAESSTPSRYAPATPELAKLLDGLAHWYSVNLVGVTDLVHSRIDKRAQQFADAFRWRRDS